MKRSILLTFLIICASYNSVVSMEVAFDPNNLKMVTSTVDETYRKLVASIENHDMPEFIVGLNGIWLTDRPLRALISRNNAQLADVKKFAIAEYINAHMAIAHYLEGYHAYEFCGVPEQANINNTNGQKPVDPKLLLIKKMVTAIGTHNLRDNATGWLKTEFKYPDTVLTYEDWEPLIGYNQKCLDKLQEIHNNHLRLVWVFSAEYRERQAHINDHIRVDCALRGNRSKGPKPLVSREMPADQKAVMIKQLSDCIAAHDAEAFFAIPNTHYLEWEDWLHLFIQNEDQKCELEQLQQPYQLGLLCAEYRERKAYIDAHTRINSCIDKRSIQALDLRLYQWDVELYKHYWGPLQ